MKSESNKISRRSFVKAAGGITFLVAGYPLTTELTGIYTGNALLAKEVSAWVEIHTDGTVRIYNPADEMGQGSMTAMAAIIAEEMDANWDQVKIEYSPVIPEIYGSEGWGARRMITVGSRTVMTYYEMLREAGAQVRHSLMKTVARHWQVAPSELSTSEGVISHAISGKEMSYGEIAALDELVTDSVLVGKENWKDPEDFKIIGKYIPRYDIPEKLSGEAVYAMDVRLPGMVYAFVSRSPVHGSRPSLQNEDEIRQAPGFVGLVEFDHGIGVVAESIKQGLDLKQQLDIQWSEGAKAASHNSTEAYTLYEQEVLDDSGWELISGAGGDNPAGQTVKNFSADYRNDYVYHAQMEPLNAVVSMADDGSADLWVGTQSSPGALSTASKALGIAEGKVRMHRCYLGGGFGRRSMSDYVHEACVIAKSVKKPVKLIWTREDDLQYGAFRPMCLQRMEAALDDRGGLHTWKHSIIGTGDRLLTTGAQLGHYRVPDQVIRWKSIDHGIRTKHWRAVGHGPNKFAIEAFINEICFAERNDPWEFRRSLMGDDLRALKVLDRAAEIADWGSPVQEGRAKGIGFAERSGSLAAGVVELSVNRRNGKIQVHKVWCVLDAGIVVQPDNAVAQMEGGILFALSSILKESISFIDGSVQESNFHNYQLLRMTDVPDEMQIEIIESNEPPSGIGEAGIPWLAGAVTGAFLDLTGKPIRHMPFSSKKVMELLKKPGV